MTRSRAGAADVPTAMNVEYYQHAGLIITEGAQHSPNGKGYFRTPGIHSDTQIARWTQVVDAEGRKNRTANYALWPGPKGYTDYPTS